LSPRLSSRGVIFSADGRWLVSGSGDKTIRIWDLDKKQEFIKLEGAPSPIAALAWHPAGRRLAAACQDKMLRLWDVVTRQEILELEEWSGSLRAVAFSKDGRYLTAGAAHGVRVWDAGPAGAVNK